MKGTWTDTASLLLTRFSRGILRRDIVSDQGHKLLGEGIDVGLNPGADIKDALDFGPQSPDVTMDDIFNEDAINGWGMVRKIYNYYIVNATIQIGNGIVPAYFASENQQVDIRKPIIVSSGSVMVRAKEQK